MIWKTKTCPDCKVLEALLKELQKEFKFTLHEFYMTEENKVDCLMYQIYTAPSLTEVTGKNHHKITISYIKDELVQNMNLKEVK